MQKAELEAKQKAIEARFTELDKEKDSHNARLQEIVKEQYQLQGQHLLLGDLIVNFPKEEKSGTKSR